MKMHSIERSDHEPLEFTGELLCESATDVIPSESGERFFRFLLYRTDVGDFVTVATLKSTVADEQEISSAERVDSATDVEDFFFAFEPDEYLQRCSGDLTPDVRADVAAELFASYEMAIRELLQHLPEEKESHPHVTDAKAPTEGDRSPTG